MIDAKEFTLARRSFSEGGRQLSDPNTHLINFELVPNMLNEIQQIHQGSTIKIWTATGFDTD